MTTPELETPGDSRAIGPVAKSLQLLDAFLTIGPAAGVTELARAAQLPKSTVFRLLGQLRSGGYVAHFGNDYQLDMRLFELGSRVEMCRPDGLRALAAPFLADLFRETSCAVHLALLDGTDVLYIDKVHGHGGPRVPTAVGCRMSAACTALGKAMLPFGHEETTEKILAAGLPRRTAYSTSAPGLFIGELTRIRETGIAFDREESALGVACVAAPIRYRGTGIAAVSVSGPTSCLDHGRLRAWVRDAAAQISVLYARQRAERSRTCA